MGAPAAAEPPSGTRIFVRVPSSHSLELHMGLVRLNVGQMVADSYEVPCFLSHLRTVPSRMESDRRGISMVIAMEVNVEIW